jgi:hypothetical protein
MESFYSVRLAMLRATHIASNNKMTLIILLPGRIKKYENIIEDCAIAEIRTGYHPHAS